MTKTDKQLLTERQLQHLRGGSIKQKPSNYDNNEKAIVKTEPTLKKKPNANRTIVHRTNGHKYAVTLTNVQAEAYSAVAANKDGLNYNVLRKYFLASTLRKLLNLHLLEIDKESLNVQLNNKPYQVKEIPKKLTVIFPWSKS